MVVKPRRRPAGTDAAGGFRGRWPWGPGGRRSPHRAERADLARLRALVGFPCGSRPTLAVLDGDLRQWIRDGSKPPELPRAGRKPARKGWSRAAAGPGPPFRPWPLRQNPCKRLPARQDRI